MSHSHRANQYTSTTMRSFAEPMASAPDFDREKISGSPSGCDTDSVLNMVHRYSEFLRELGDRFAGQEPVNDVLHAIPARHEYRRAGRPGRINDNLGVAISGNSEELDVAVLEYRKPCRYSSITSANTR